MRCWHVRGLGKVTFRKKVRFARRAAEVTGKQPLLSALAPYPSGGCVSVMLQVDLTCYGSSWGAAAAGCVRAQQGGGQQGDGGGGAETILCKEDWG